MHESIFSEMSNSGHSPIESSHPMPMSFDLMLVVYLASEPAPVHQMVVKHKW